MEYKDYVSILLTAITVVLAVLAVAITFATVWGYKTIKDAAIEAALKVVNSHLETMVDGEHIKDKLHEIVQDKIDKAGDQVYGDFAATSYPEMEGEA